MSSVIDSFNKARAMAQAKMMQPTTTSTKKFAGRNEVQLCGRGVGMYFGAFILDTEGVPLRVIDGYRSLRVNREVAEKYGIDNYELRICDPSNYKDLTPEQSKLIGTLNKMLEEIGKNWDAWQGKIAKYPPRWNRHLTIQYMKIVRKSDLQGIDVQDFEPGVKVIMSRSDAYFKAFDEFITAQNTINGSMDFISNMVARDVRHRPCMYLVKSSLPAGAKSYSFAFQEVARPVDLTDEDLRLANDLNKEVVDITNVNTEELIKWNHLFKDTYASIKEGVYENSEPAIVEEKVKAVEAEPPKEEFSSEDDPFKV